MADEVTSESKIEDLDIENMKVAELKKKLKDIGLPVTGNKSELVERLQGSLLAAKNNAAPNSGELESSNSELDSSILNDNKVNSSSAEPEDKDNTKTCDDESLVVSPEKSKEAPVISSAFIPLKKRVVAQTSAGNSEKPKEKKIVLNRNHIPTPKFIPNKPAEPLKIKSISMDDKNDSPKNKESKEDTVTAITIKEGSTKICLNAAKNVSEDEKFSRRAKRFNIVSTTPETTPETTSKSGKITITSKKDVATNPKSTSSSILTPSTTTTADLLQKRALRFGGNVSGLAKQMDEEEKAMKRKAKFSIGNGVSSEEEQEKKKKRAERFGLL